MKERKILVLSTLAFFVLALGATGFFRAFLTQKPIVIHSELYPSIGNAQAKIEVVVFEDFVCHTCRYFTMEVFPAIQATYIEPGTVRYVMIPISISPQSLEVANAALTVFYQAPESYFPFVREFFLRFSEKRIDLKDLVQLAKEFEEINLVSFEKSVKEGRFNAQLAQNFQLAMKAMKKNVRTPAVFINGMPIPGISFESISSHIEKLVNKEAL